MGQSTSRNAIPFPGVLKGWLVFVACLRLLSVYFGYFDIQKFRMAVFNAQPQLVNPLVGRLFASWTMVTCALCIICSRNITNRPLYGATLLSFIVAITFFALEFLVFKTVNTKGLMSPLIVASLSSLWMSLGWFKGKSEPAQHYNVTALRRWLMLFASMRLYTVYLGYANVEQLQSMVADLVPEQANPVYGHLFSAWTLITSIVALLCSRNPTDPAIYGATLTSLLITLGSFTSECFLFKSISFRNAWWPLVSTGLSVIWMGAGWNYYTKYCKDMYNDQKSAGSKGGVSSHPLVVDGREEDGPSESSAPELKKAE